MRRASLSPNAMKNERLHRIANVLLLNASFIEDLGLLNGKMGIAIFFYNYSRYIGNKTYEDFAGELIDEIYEEINTNTPVNFESGLTGIGWGIEYLIKSKFVHADSDEALVEIDDSVYRNSLYSPFLIENGNDLFGYGLYYVARLQGRENDDNELKTLFKKQHLIYLIDECDRILIMKQFLNFNIQSLNINAINSLTWFILEMFKIGLFPTRIAKLFNSLPEYIELCLQSRGGNSGKSQLKVFVENVVTSLEDPSLKHRLREILKKNFSNSFDQDDREEDIVNDFIIRTWQHLLYSTYLIEFKRSTPPLDKVNSIIDNEENWNKRLDNLNNTNQGLIGLAGLGLGLIFDKVG